MYLIAKNKIANYIKQHPEVGTSFLVWLKEFPYREGERSFNHNKEFPPQLNTTVESQFSNANYKIRYRVNHFLKTTYIDWVGTVDEYRAHTQKEREDMLALYPDMKVGYVVTKMSLTPPDFDKIAKSREVKPADITIADQPHAPEINFDQATDFLFKTTAEYEAGLTRALNIFDAAPSTTESLELATLIPRLIHYENRFILFGELAPLTVIKLKMQERGIVSQYPLDLIKLIGSKEELDQFLSDEKPLSKQALAVLYNYLKIDFMDSEA